MAKLLISIFNSAGAGFPASSTVLLPRTVIFAFVVGVGVTLASVIIPARRAAQHPAGRGDATGAGVRSTRAPSASSSGRSSRSSGAAAFVIGLFLQPGGTIGLIAFAAGGGLLLFLGVASVSSTVARPVTKLIGWPVAKLFGTTGVLARENAGRAPRRTSATAAALMIGVALVSAASVFAASLRSTFTGTLERSVKADYIVTDESFQGLAAGGRPDPVRSEGAVGGHRRARHDGARRRQAEGDRRRRPAGIRAARQHQRDVGQLRGTRPGRHLRPQGPGQRPPPEGR